MTDLTLIAQATKQMSINDTIITGVAIQTPLLLGGLLVHTYLCDDAEERPKISLFSTGMACIFVGLAANAVFFTKS